jgi:hypothetical protein
MSLPANQAVLPPPSQPSTLSYGMTANIDATNSYPNGYAINLTTTQIGAFLATVPSLIQITAGSSTQAVWIKNTSGNMSSPSVVVCEGGTVNGKLSYALIANGQFIIFTGDGSGNLITSEKEPPSSYRNNTGLALSTCFVMLNGLK